MAYSVTIANMITRAKYLANMENHELVSASEWQIYLALDYEQLHGQAVSLGTRCFESTQSITGDGNQTYALDAAVLHVLAVDYVVNATSDQRIPLTELMAQERSSMIGLTGQATHYAVEGGNLALYPKPSKGTYKLLYAPIPIDYSGSVTSTEIDFLCPAGARWVQWAMAARALAKEESENRFQLGERDTAWGLFTEWCTQRSLQTPRYQVHVDDRGTDYGDYMRHQT